ncbi:MAG: DUF6600 domain-containing protein [Betaproteobacteria bacterium]
MQRWLAVIVAFVVAGCTTVTPAEAQSPAGEPPLIAGRIAVADGDAQIWRTEEDGAAGQWDGAVVNDVVSTGTGLYTGGDGRNEVRVGPHTFRMASNSRGGFSQLDYSVALFNLEYGTLNVRLARPEHGETTSVTLAGLRIDLVAPGRYRIDATDRGPARLTVFEGHGTVRSTGSTIGVGSVKAVVVNPGGGFAFEQPIESAFDQWALERDAQFQQVRSAQFVSPYMTGYEELDAYGDWSSDASFGMVWFPRAVPVGWAPYRFGQWRWVHPWGWTWVDFAPWGFAPFHYGRWVMVGPRWAWVPGGFVRQPVWAPALVGFVGTGVSVSVSVGTPLVGWYPLAPWHRYEPHYRHGPRYVTIINQTIINQPPRGMPRDLTQGPGTTMVPGPRFREPIHRVALPVPPKPQDLKPVAPPPLNVAPAPRSPTPRFSDQDERPGTPKSQMVRPPQQVPAQPQPGSPPTRVTPPMAVDPMPGRGVTPQPPLPGNDPAPLRQPPGLNKVQPAPQAPAPAAPTPPRAAPRPHLPSDQIPPGQPQPVNPAEPPRFPPGAPPTIRQPQPMVPAARPVQPSPSARAPAAPPPAPRVAPPTPADGTPPRAAPPGTTQPAPARPTPPAAVPAPAPVPRAQPPQSQKEQVLRNQPEPQRGYPVEREAPPMRPKQMDR